NATTPSARACCATACARWNAAPGSSRPNMTRRLSTRRWRRWGWRCGRCEPLVPQDRNRARPARGATMHFDGEAHDLEAVRRQRFQIVQFLQMRIADLAAGAVAFPDQ